MIIFADDIGTGDIPFYWNTGTSKVDMPNIQALASKGVMFTDAHSTPLCAPSRYMLLSGNYAHRGRLRGGTWNILGQHNQFRSHEMSIAESLQNNGYHTAMFGKWHLGGKVPPNGIKSESEILSSSQHNWAKPLIDGPQTIGFDESRITTQGIQYAPYSFFRNGYLETTVENIKFWEAGEYPMPQGTSMIRENYEGEGDISWDSSAYNMILVNETMDFLDDHLENRNDDPFFAYVALGAAHIPHR
jgi:arylsulfatase A-like enzyme